MPPKNLTGAEIRQSFIDYFVNVRHTFVPSSSLVPGGDQTLLFTNAGMVQFKEVFLGTDIRPYTRAVNSQKCMRVAGKHNDLEDVGFDDTHHTFFEMLGNWSFGDYYKKETIAWAWHLFTEVWELPKAGLWATCFEDEKGEIERDDEAAGYWRQQEGFNPEHLMFFGRKDNFWEMAETGPCGPNSEIHIDMGPGHCVQEGLAGHTCRVNLSGCTRFLELWNLVFIQYNRTGPRSLEQLPAKHVDTGMGLERVTSILQGVDSNYKTDLLSPMMDTIQRLTGHTDEERTAQITPYRVITDHARSATFLIADGVVPGNTGRNYVCRMIVRRAARFGSKLGLQPPFLAQVAETVIENYGSFYPELVRNRATILENLRREETRFARTVEAGVGKLEVMLERLQGGGETILSGETAFDLYATYGLPLEITRDIAREQGLEVDEPGFQSALEDHRQASGAGEAFGVFGDEGVVVYLRMLAELQSQGLLGPEGVVYDPYQRLNVKGTVLALVRDGERVTAVEPGDLVEVLLPETCFYVEAGGQIADTGVILSAGEPTWEIQVKDTRCHAAGVIVHAGKVIQGQPRQGDSAIAHVDTQRRRDIMRNHTATHLLHAELRAVLGEHARQAGSLVAPDRLRFDFTHPEPVTSDQLARIEASVNRHILENYRLDIMLKPLTQAVAEGATALFGEKYTETVRTITIGGALTSRQDGNLFSYELCGGTHVSDTGDIGLFLITSEGSVGAGLRRIEAVTGRGAYELVQRRFRALAETAAVLDASAEQAPEKARLLVQDLAESHKQIAGLRRKTTTSDFLRSLESVPVVAGVPVLTATLPGADADTLRQMTDRFRQRYPSGVAVVASVSDGRPMLVAAISEDLVERGLHAGELVKFVAQPLGGSGGGRPTLAQAGGKEASNLEAALASVPGWVAERLKMA
ncbi:MAG TPA: alanine--tRNA ligase [Anaerolineales bacterium]|nr:alanine--tRNA ligase [Anaerolineales bacterium]